MELGIWGVRVATSDIAQDTQGVTGATTVHLVDTKANTAGHVNRLNVVKRADVVRDKLGVATIKRHSIGGMDDYVRVQELDPSWGEPITYYKSVVPNVVADQLKMNSQPVSVGQLKPLAAIMVSHYVEENTSIEPHHICLHWPHCLHWFEECHLVHLH